MSPEPWRDRIAVMIEDIDRIQSFIGGRDRENFSKDEKSVFAVSYAFVRLGEAVGHIPKSVVEDHPEIEWGDVRHFRNFMIHVYDRVDPARLHDTAMQELAELRRKLQELIA